MSENDLCDIYRIRNPETKRFTRRRKTPFKQRRLDYFLISECLQEAVQTIEIIPSVQSDHSALTSAMFRMRQEAEAIRNVTTH